MNVRPARGRGRTVPVIVAVAVAGVAALAGGCAGSPPGPPDRPNIVFVISDDQDWKELGFMGTAMVRTPHLDRLAREGTVFSRAHLPMSRCRPTLASFLSGRWPHRSGLYFAYGKGGLDPAGSLPRLLRDAGYATFVGGKFWEGDAHAMGFTHGNGNSANTFVRKGQEDAFDFIDRLGGKKPLFLWWAPKIPHVPHDPPAEQLAAVDRSRIRVPPWIPPERRDAFREKEHLTFAMEGWLDSAFGQLEERLRARGIHDNTLFVFLIDNGWANGSASKGTPYENGVRTPIVFAWPGRIRAGQFLDRLTSTLDVFPTMLEYAGVPVPDDADGASLRPFLEGGEGEAREMLFGAIYPAFSTDGDQRPEHDVYALYARDDRWKYILYLQDVTESENVERLRIQYIETEFPERHAGDEELFDLSADPVERTNLAGLPESAARVRAMREAALAWWRDSGGRPLDGVPGETLERMGLAAGG